MATLQLGVRSGKCSIDIGILTHSGRSTGEDRECQLKKPSSTLRDLNPNNPAPPLTRWAVDFTSDDQVPIFVAVEYANGLTRTGKTFELLVTQ